ncbi:hypothetical protein [Neptunomonas qingdaonensis]|uniref:Uncharacterized protein n=1 Tax=Neptunomonas qingdaonensis TaxID=1045558 RepID=A0A1I2V7L2_9GAMM|nr:hypothetical protein [Neptunomonas qingdaonensis]SFG84187.1 hypothetical protein SAMN05216175_11560 [Neptunomonas qingdaonensis]
MNTNDLLKAIENFVDTNKRERITRYESLKRLMKKLKIKQNLLKDTVKNETNKKCKKRLEEKIRVLKAQRKKGLKLLKELKSEI